MCLRAVPMLALLSPVLVPVLYSCSALPSWFCGFDRRLCPSGECSRAVSGQGDSELFWGGRALFCPWVLSSEGTLSAEEMFQPLADTWLPSCQGWARPPGCLPVTASPLLIHGLSYLTEEWVHLQPAHALPCLSLSQGWCSMSLKCEFKRHTPVVVSG